VLTTLQVNSLFYFNRSPVSRALFGSHRIRATLAGDAPPCGVRCAKCCPLDSVPQALKRSDVLQHLQPHALREVESLPACVNLCA
jgi:hypothetical protein